MNKTYLDSNGYLRFKDTDKLLHRWIAFNQVYKKTLFGVPFGRCQVHHKDGNKLNNQAWNLEVLTDRQHRKTHHIKHPFVRFFEWLFGKKK